jgi:hypothetical protein
VKAEGKYRLQAARYKRNTAESEYNYCPAAVIERVPALAGSERQ